MPADRFFIDTDLKNIKRILLEGAEHHHLAHVMKLRAGDAVELVNGRGYLSIGKIAEAGRKNAAIEIFETTHSPDAPLRILLAVPLMRASKLEWIIEKGTEIGANAFLFYPAQYSEKEDLSPRQLERLRTLEIAALKQSGRLYLPSLEILTDLASLFILEALFFFGDTRSIKPIDFSPVRESSTIVFVSGPEKGFSSEELSYLETRAKAVSLSAYTLRAETAPIVAASILGTRRLPTRA